MADEMLTNMCLNLLTSARARRETYVGQWLPEPVPAACPGQRHVSCTAAAAPPASAERPGPLSP